MFFQGTLHEGIGAAVQQAKSVVCFVTDGESESQQWETEFLTDETVASLLESQAVTLRLTAGSQEEGFLVALFPVPKKPTVIVIKNGELKEYIAAGVSKDEFMRRIRSSLASPTPSQEAHSQPEPSVATTQPTAAQAAPVSAATQQSASQPDPVPVPAPAPAPVVTSSQLPATQPTYSGENSTTGSSGGPATPPSSSESQFQSRRQEEERARLRRAAKGKGKAQPDPEPKVKDTNDTVAQSKHAEQLKRRQKEAREERRRILKAIEDDKAARKARQSEKEAERRGGGGGDEKTDPAAPSSAATSQLPPSSSSTGSEKCAIQVRLLDGSTIRSRFASSTDTLKDVRKWVDETGNPEAPYTFKVLLTPRPSKSIDVTEEEQSLRSLDLAPSATLILVAVPRYTAAYNGPSTGGTFFGVLVAFFSSLFSTNGPPAAAAATAPTPALAALGGGDRSSKPSSRDGSRIRGFGQTQPETRKDEQQQQFYNGNSTNFQPRRDDDEEQ
ncbi:hypothetical protein B0T19DRAFT_395983 [Cercophora scortea]|uniref:UBX domain-containing protein 2 n=1 Tax=Cercophora scortea TaxID=314031 RepID=A0AAE0J3E0_9PEZI|nr:hypothetical protein B0T19DRAFT_395983 [Cercophora scortea]